MTRESEMSTEPQVAPDAATQNPASEPTETPEVVAPEASTEQQADEPQAPEVDPREKAVKSLTRRVDRITAARYQAEARAQQAAQEAEALRQRLSQYEQQEPAPQQRQADPIALAREIATLEKVTERSNTVHKDGVKRFEGFDKALQAVIEEAGPLVVPVAPGAPFGKPTALGEAVLDADDPAAVLHHLGNNPDLAAELNGLSPTQIARRIARIEIELAKPREPKQSNAPKPISPVRSPSNTSDGLDSSLPIDEWMRRRNEQLKGRRN